ncbi:MAG: PspC domain-containing protein [Tannerellaceae bacterium]|jgi:phage shock protein PspC (stress-responsive transcriptional regulator)|nr:PspC domain-containing protein [Tannerellaceae bacterium]
MKKTLTVNLGGSVFHIDEDAYLLLEKYLSNLRIHFEKEDGGEETLGDMEQRISEIFSEKNRAGFNVITIEDVENIIQRMGKVEDLFENDFRTNKKSSREERSQSSHGGERIGRKFFRNPDDKMLGGVCGGLAAFMGWDPTAVRLLTFLLACFGGVVVFIYLVLWLIVPLAQTAAERLQMCGESVTIENIGKTVTDGFERFSHQVNEYVNSDKPRTMLQKFADIIVGILGALLKVAAVFLGIILLPALVGILLAFVCVVIGLIFGGVGGIVSFLGWLLPSMDWNIISSVSPFEMSIGGISLIMLFAIPLLTMIYGLLCGIFKYKPLANELKWLLVILWLMAFVCIIYCSVSHGWWRHHWMI